MFIVATNVVASRPYNAEYLTFHVQKALFEDLSDLWVQTDNFFDLINFQIGP